MWVISVTQLRPAENILCCGKYFVLLFLSSALRQKFCARALVHCPWQDHSLRQIFLTSQIFCARALIRVPWQDHSLRQIFLTSQIFCARVLILGRTILSVTLVCTLARYLPLHFVSSLGRTILFAGDSLVRHAFVRWKEYLTSKEYLTLRHAFVRWKEYLTSKEYLTLRHAFVRRSSKTKSRKTKNNRLMHA
jgi:hypothetical protein